MVGVFIGVIGVIGVISVIGAIVITPISLITLIALISSSLFLPLPASFFPILPLSSLFCLIQPFSTPYFFLKQSAARIVSLGLGEYMPNTMRYSVCIVVRFTEAPIVPITLFLATLASFATATLSSPA